MATTWKAPTWRMPNEKNQSKFESYSLDFDGSNDYVDTGDAFTSLTSFSISAWFKSDDTSTAAQGIVSSRINSIGSSQGLDLNISGDVLYARVFNNGATEVTTAFTDTASWHHVAMIYNGTTLEMYLDGVSKGTATGVYTNSAANWVIGKWNNGAYYFDGSISQLSFFDYALSSTQISTLYGSSELGSTSPMALKPQPVAYYPLGDNSASNPLTQPNEAVEDASVFKFDDAPSNNFIDLGLINAIENSTSFTLSFWINPSSFTTPFTLLGNKTGFSGDSAKGIAFDVRSTFLIVYLSDDFTDYARVNNPLSLNKWTLLSVVYDGSGATNADRLKIYYGSTQQTVNTFGGTIPSTSPTTGRSLILGKQATGQCIEASISNFTIFSNALPTTGTESIETLYNNGVPLNSITSENLKAWYKLDQSANWDVSGSGNWTIPDASGNGNDGISSGMTSANLVLSDLTRALPYDSYSFNFDGTADYVNISSAIDVTDDKSFSLWIKRNTGAAANDGGILTIVPTSGTSDYISIALWQDYIQVQTSNVTTTRKTVEETISTNVWYHIVVIKSNNSIDNIYINGVNKTLSNFGTWTGTITTPQNKIGEAVFGGTNYNFDGQISNISLFNETLTSTEVLKLYSNGVPQDLSSFSPAPVAWYPLGSNSFWNGSAWTVRDMIGSNDGTGQNIGIDGLVGDSPRSSAGGTGINMDVPTNLEGSTKWSDNNSWSINMSETARVEDTP